ncbi:hypothetical protein ACQFZR_001461 [Raoultella ornithinolytica]|nr:hypothetical protein [Klebsiella michiganensis]
MTIRGRVNKLEREFERKSGVMDPAQLRDVSDKELSEGIAAIVAEGGDDLVTLQSYGYGRRSGQLEERLTSEDERHGIKEH